METFPDSERYFSPHSVFSLENAGFFYSIFVRAFDQFPGIVLGQVLFSCFSWIFLSWALIRLFPGWLGLFTSVLTLTIAAQQSVVSWNNLVLSESTAISMTALWLASLLLFLKPSPRKNLFALQTILLTLTTVLMTTSRPQLALIVFPVLITAIAYGWKKYSQLMRWLLSGISGLILIYSMVRLASLSLWSPFGSAYTQHLIDFRQSFTLYALEKYGCSDLFTGLEGQLAKYSSDCPSLQSAITDNNLGFISWVLARPTEAFSTFVQWLSGDAVLPHYSSSATVLAPEHANAFLSINYSLTNIMLYFFAGAVVILAIRLLQRTASFSMLRFFLAAALLLCTLFYIFLSWGVDGIELARHALPMSLFLPLMIPITIFWVFTCDDAQQKRLVFKKASFSLKN